MTKPPVVVVEVGQCKMNNRRVSRSSRPLRRGSTVPSLGRMKTPGRQEKRGKRGKKRPSLTGEFRPTILAGYFTSAAPHGAGMDMEGTGLKKKDLKRFRDILLSKKKELSLIHISEPTRLLSISYA